MFMCVHMFVCRYGGPKLMSGIFPSCSPLWVFFLLVWCFCLLVCFLRQVLQLAHTDSTSSANQSPGPSWVCAFHVGITAMDCCVRIFLWTPSIWIQSLVFARQALYQLIHHPFLSFFSPSPLTISVWNLCCQIMRLRFHSKDGPPLTCDWFPAAIVPVGCRDIRGSL